MKALTLALTIFAPLVGAVLLLHWLRGEPRKIVIEGGGLVGKPMPADAACTHVMPYDEDMYCIRGTTSIVVSRQDRRVITTYVEVQETTIGDLINVWGMPTGIQDFNLVRLVYWDRVYAYVDAYPYFAPSSPVSHITYLLTIPTVEPWRGFTNHDYRTPNP
jgi:hypothetical protein